MSARDDHRSSNRARSRSRSDSRSRSRSPSRERSSKRSKDRSSKHSAIPEGSRLDAKKDYFLKQSEFRLWLKDEKQKYVDELSGEKSRSYFKKFVKAWNRGELPSHFYSGIDSTALAATNNTSYRWSFASNRSKVDKGALEAVRNDVGASTNGRSFGADEGSETGPSKGKSTRPRVAGPTLPSAGDRVLMDEDRQESMERERMLKRKREKAEDRERIEDLVGPKETGREGMLEKKKAKREIEAAHKDQDGGLEVSEDVMMGSGSNDSFQAAIARRDAARKRFEEKKRGSRGDQSSDKGQRINAMKEKEAETMAMFAKMAKERYG